MASILEKAAACHSAWFAYEVIGRGKPGLPWWACSDEHKKSIINGVEKIEEVLSSTDFDSLELEDLCVIMHDNWLNFKKLGGWTYGPVKDEVKKEHPCLVEYKDLPNEEKEKDKVFIQAFLSMKSCEYNVINEEASGTAD